MSRLELLAVMYSIERMCEQDDFAGVKKVVGKIIKEAESQSRKNKRED